MGDAPRASASPVPAPVNTDLSGNASLRVQRFNNGWTKEQEELMAGWADIASSYRWMHDKCEKKLSRSNMGITVPVIILSTLTGSANFMLQSISGGDQDIQKFAQLGIGAVSIFTGILTTLGNFFRYAQGSESNRVASIAWGKFQRQIAVELALHPKERIDALDFLKICRSELDRLIEQSPPIPDDIIKAFEKEFEDLPDLKRPDIAHGMDHTKVFNNKDERTKKIIVDAVQMLKQKRKVWHEHMMPEVDKRLKNAITDLSGSLFTSMQAKVKELEEVVKRQAEQDEGGAEGHFTAASPGSRTIFRSFLRVPNLSRDPLKSERIREQMISSLIEDSKRSMVSTNEGAVVTRMPSQTDLDTKIYGKV